MHCNLLIDILGYNDHIWRGFILFFWTVIIRKIREFMEVSHASETTSNNKVALEERKL